MWQLATKNCQFAGLIVHVLQMETKEPRKPSSLIVTKPEQGQLPACLVNAKETDLCLPQHT